MSEAMPIPHPPAKGLDLSLSPTRSCPQPGSPGRFFQIPSPIITRRTRTFSTSERAASNPVQSGKIKYFCRQKGHGFIHPNDGTEDIFFHISDIEGEYAPNHGDEVTYKLCPIPPKNEKMQAIHVLIVHLGDSTHERWDCPPSPLLHVGSAPNT